MHSIFWADGIGSAPAAEPNALQLALLVLQGEVAVTGSGLTDVRAFSLNPNPTNLLFQQAANPSRELPYRENLPVKGRRFLHEESGCVRLRWRVRCGDRR